MNNETSPKIFKAVYSGRLDRLAQAIAAGESVNGAIDHQGCSPLAAAILREDMPMAQALLDAGANPNRQAIDSHQLLPLEAAASRQSLPLLAMLIERGLNLSEPGGRGPSSRYNPLKTCMSFQFVDGLEMLLDVGRNFDSWWWKEESLAAAAQAWRAESPGVAMWQACVELLIRRGADVDHALEDEMKSRNVEGFDALRRAKAAWDAKLEAEELESVTAKAESRADKAQRI